MIFERRNTCSSMTKLSGLLRHHASEVLFTQKNKYIGLL
jgi:hypothetical protein